jgi:hypothetical protein
MMMLLWKEKEGRTRKAANARKTRARDRGSKTKDRGGETKKSKETGKPGGKETQKEKTRSCGRQPCGRQPCRRQPCRRRLSCGRRFVIRGSGGSIPLPTSEREQDAPATLPSSLNDCEQPPTPCIGKTGQKQVARPATRARR